ncbi:phosphoribosylformylglycinamidine synthase [candidate division TA06 bacterium SM23_40]|uniref:Phosphoribosylformylglycinamidine synthase subunit PurQ n=1 Tax=candidate division TA06 bacterium SM23_40 TaxID=1703774 RepID=A0A0S8G8Y9_UNCT6|nr:MAG: phosphoribosylformylglycinamidine synthase [candidate division TA06 bacterium SM23_40]
MNSVRVLILRTAGTNCDLETAHAFERAGAEVGLVHINRLKLHEVELAPYHIFAIPGGFTYGDDIAAGKILANELRRFIFDEISQFIAQGRLVLGICNGFQVLVKAGLLPDPANADGPQQVTLTYNDSGRFEDRWVWLRVVNGDRCVFTRGIGHLLHMPVAHAEGKFIAKESTVLQRLQTAGSITFEYVHPEGRPADYPWNPNGSIGGIAGICDASGRILGLMPHPERHVDPTQHPRWTREGLKHEGDGLVIFRNAVEFARKHL